MLVRCFTDSWHCSQHQNRFFCFLLTLNVKNMVHLGDGDIWLKLVESFTNLGLHLPEELLPVEPARDTGYQTILLSSIKSNARTHPSHTHLLRLFKISILIKQNHQWVPTPGGEKLRAELFTYWQESILSCLQMSTESDNLSSLRSRRQKGSL